MRRPLAAAPAVITALVATLFLLAAVPRALLAQYLGVYPDGTALIKGTNTSGSVNFGVSGLQVGQTYYREIGCDASYVSCGSNTGQSFTAQASNTGIVVNYTTLSRSWTGKISLKVYKGGMTPMDTGWFNLTIDASPPEVRLLGPTTSVSITNPTIQLAWCDDRGLNAGSRSITVNGVNRTADFNYTAGGPSDCPNAATSTTNTVSLAMGTNTIVGYVCDNLPRCTTTTFTIVRLPRNIAVRPELPERQQFAGTAGSQRFFVKNIETALTSLTIAAGCTNTVSGCTVSPTTLANMRSGETRPVTVTYNVAAGGPGSAWVKAYDANNSDSSAVTITPVSAPYPVVSVVDVNPGPVVARDLCVTASTGSGTAFECGDLRVVHALPGIRTLNKARVPTLLYNSAHADPYPIVAASVTLASGATIPTAVEGVLKINGVEKARGQWAGTDWTAGSTRRIAIGYSASGDTTDVYDYSFEVATIYGTTRNPTTVAGKLVVVNRRNGGFGAGWWLAGLERLEMRADGSKLWVAGDGSAQLYTAIGSNRWVAPAVDGPDTLSFDGTTYTRSLSGGLKVQFNSAGQHVATINRLGHQTSFGYTNNLLTAITLPAAGGGQVYTFNYDGNSQLSTVVAPGAPNARTTTVTITGTSPASMRLDAIQDPDARSITFTYEDATTRRIASRTNKRLVTTYFSYDAAKKLVRAKTDAQPDSTRLGFAAIDARGLLTASPNTAVDTATAYTILYGARTYATDTAKRVGQETWISVDRFGAPRRVRDPGAYVATIRREDGEWPALATETTDPSSFVVRAGYDGRGNVLYNLAVNPFGDGRDTLTRYHWDTKWDAVDSIITPSGLTTTIGYDATNGNRLWQQTGPDAARQVSFAYTPTGPAAGLLQSVMLQGTPADQLGYDGQGNPGSYTTPRGFVTRILNDAIGRTFQTRQQVDVADTTRMLVVTTDNDVMDRPTEVISTGKATSDPSTTIKYERDREGADSVITRWTSPDAANVQYLVTRIFRDALGRVVKQVAPDGAFDSTRYDVAGNVEASYDRNVDPATLRHDSLTFLYDVLNRMRSRRTAAKHFEPEVIGLARAQLTSPDAIESVSAISGYGLSRSYPWIAPDVGYDVPSVADTFVYSPTDGRLTDANNSVAAVHFTYYRNGLLKAEQNTVAPWAGCASWPCTGAHSYTNTITYDVDGRRTNVAYPGVIAMGTGSVAYAYNAYGDLSSVTDFENHVTQFTVNARGELKRKLFPEGTAETLAYDYDGNLVADTMRFSNSQMLFAAALGYDARGSRASMSGVLLGGNYGDNYSYDVLGQLVSSTDNMPDKTTTSSFTMDGLGNVSMRSGADASISYSYWSVTKQTTGNSPQEWNFYIPNTGRLWYSKGVSNPDTTGQLSGGGGIPASMNHYDMAGNVVWTGPAILRQGAGVSGTEAAPQGERRMYYGPDAKLHAIETRGLYRAPNAPNTASVGGFSYSFEEYRYDAVGRRVVTRTDQECDYNPEYNQYNPACHVSGLRRTIWDGQKELGEIRVPLEQAENDTYVGQGTITSSSINLAPFYGAVAYVYDGKLDQPLAVTRLRYSTINYSNQVVTEVPFTYYPAWDVHGLAVEWLGIRPPGMLPECLSTDLGGEKVTCVFRVKQNQWLPYRDITNVWQKAWQGGLVEDKIGPGGLMYRRNRYYDSKSGRFTQEDPIGLAGGLNAYGFADGDPVNYADPFGLCPSIPGTTAPCTLFAAVWAEGRSASMAFQLNVAGAIISRAGFHDGNYEAVVWKRKAFSFTAEKPPKNGNLLAFVKAYNGKETSEKFHKMAGLVESLYAGEANDPSNGATLYYSPQSMKPPGSAPYWVDSKKMTKTTDLGNEGKFYRCNRSTETC